MSPRAPILAAAVLVLLPTAAAAELVQHTYTGVVTFVSDGAFVTLDLTGTFSPGQEFTLVTTIDRATPAIPQAPALTYPGVVTEWAMSIGSYVRPSGPVTGASTIRMIDDFILTPGTPPDIEDEFQLQLPNPGSPTVGVATPTYLLVDLIDDEGTQFDSRELPRTMPDMSNFETATWTLIFGGEQTSGMVSGTLSDVSTPAVPVSWGRVKAGYRR